MRASDGGVGLKVWCRRRVTSVPPPSPPGEGPLAPPPLPPRRRRRRAVPRRLREAVWARDGGRCAECDAALPPDAWVLDHAVPWSVDAAHEARNLRALCLVCHRRKSTAEAALRAAIATADKATSGLPSCWGGCGRLLPAAAFAVAEDGAVALRCVSCALEAEVDVEFKESVASARTREELRKHGRGG